MNMTSIQSNTVWLLFFLAHCIFCFSNLWMCKFRYQWMFLYVKPICFRWLEMVANAFSITSQVYVDILTIFWSNQLKGCFGMMKSFLEMDISVYWAKPVNTFFEDKHTRLSVMAYKLHGTQIQDNICGGSLRKMVNGKAPTWKNDLAL